MAVLGNRSLAYEPFVQDDTVGARWREGLMTVAAIQDWTLAMAKFGNPPISVCR